MARFRVWTHRSPALVLGIAQRSLRQRSEDRAKGRLAIVEREAGGGAVLAGPWMVSASIALPAGHPLLAETLAGSYRWLGEVHARALEQLGVPARALPPQEIAGANAALRIRSVGWACFGALSPWEVVAADGSKLVGLAQRRKQTGVLLVAGTLVGATDWGLLCKVMGCPEDEAVLRRRTVAAAELAGRPIAPEAFAAVLARLLAAAVGVEK